MIDQKKPWLAGITWESIVNLNRAQCQAQKLEPKNNARTYATTERSWEQAESKGTTLIEAFDACRRACDQAPFTFNNGNTFAGAARQVLDEYLKNAPAVEAQILRTTVCHYVAGTIDRNELAEVLKHLAPLFRSAPPQSAPPAPPARAESEALSASALAQAQPVATT